MPLGGLGGLGCGALGGVGLCPRRTAEQGTWCALNGVCLGCAGVAIGGRLGRRAPGRAQARPGSTGISGIAEMQRARWCRKKPANVAFGQQPLGFNNRARAPAA